MAGYPDWQAYPQWRGSSVLDATVNGVAGSTVTLGSWAWTSWASLLLTTGTIGAGGTLQLQSSDDPLFSSYVVQQQWVVNTVTGLHALVPVMGDYARLTLASPAGAAAQMMIMVKPSNISAAEVQYPAPANFISQHAVILSAGQSATYYMPYVQPGWAQWQVTHYAGTGSIRFYVRTTDAAVNIAGTLLFIENPSGGQQGQVWLPDQPCSITLSADGTTTGEADIGLWAT